jgi:hypothetical protein
VDILGDGRIVALSERLRSLISTDDLVVQYDDPLAGLAVRRLDADGSQVAVLWEGA